MSITSANRAPQRAITNMAKDTTRGTTVNDGGKTGGIAKVEFPVSKYSDAETIDLLVTARITLLLKNGFLGPIASHLLFIDASKWCPTAATDGRYFYYNKDFIAALPAAQRVFLIGHEVLHCVYEHMDPDRVRGRIPMLWNVAADFVINYELEQTRVGEVIDVLQICLDHQYADMTTEEVYEKLGGNKMEEEIKEMIEQMKANGMGTLDDHLPQGPGEGEGDENGETEGPGEDGPAQFTQDAIDEINSDMKDSVIQSASSCKNAGDIPAGVKRMIDEMLAPIVDWRELLAQEIKSLFKSNHNWNMPSRRGQNEGIYLPSMDYDETIDICISIDTSGSVDEDMLRDFISEIAGIMGQYADFKIKIWCFDGIVQIDSVKDFTANNMYDFQNYALLGGGGTSFQANWEYMKKEGIEPGKFIMFTDGYPCDGWGDEHYCDTLFIVHGGNGQWARREDIPEAPYGQTVPYYRPEES